MGKKNNFLKKFVWSFIFMILISGFITVSVFYNKIYDSNVSLDYSDELEVFIPSNADFDMVVGLLSNHGVLSNIPSFVWTAKQKKYTKIIKPGRYIIKNGMNNNELVNLLRSGKQTPVRLTFNNVRTIEQLCGKIGSQIELDSIKLLNSLKDSVFLNSIDLNKYNVPSLFIPNTYEIYWDVSLEKFLNRMVSEHHRFWNSQRRKKAKKLNLRLDEVSTLASIVEKETLKKDEQSTVAGLYLNRLKKNMKLQSDPTVIFAIGDFTIKRVLNKDLKFKSPYNTYLNKGLPPGPITIPSIRAIDAVLNFEKHDYLFMCAKEDFSGYHNFANNGVQHMVNARKYRNALNKKGIKR
ncbi:MAG: endolytic transglycosylase MltG [Flavobacteriales bacterium]